MSTSADVEGILGEATGLERRYKWLEASEFYEQALRLVDEGDYFRRGGIQEKIGYCLQRGAFQAESREEFLERLRRAVEAYEEAHGLYERGRDEVGAGWALRCGAVVRYLEYWIATDSSEKKRLLDECLNLERDTLETFWDDGDKREYCRTYSELPELFWHRMEREYTWQTEPTHEIFIRQQQIIEEGIRWGESAVEALSELGDPYMVAKAHTALGICYYYQAFRFVEEPEEQEQYRLRAVDYIRKATEISEEVGDDYLIGQSFFWLAQASHEKDGIRHLENALKYAEKTRDIYLLGLGLSLLVHASSWVRVFQEEDPDKKKELAEEILALYDEAVRHLSILSFYGYIGGVIRPPGGHSEHFYNLALWETNPEKKVEFLDKSLESGNKALKIAEDSGTRVGYVGHVFSKALTARARLESEINKKKSLLERAIEYRERYITSGEQLNPYHYWNRGIGYDYLSNIKAELANTEPDLGDKRRLLEEAVRDKGKALPLMVKWVHAVERRVHMYGRLSQSQDEYVTQLTNLHDLTNEPEYLRRAIEASQKAIESASKVDFVSRIAESYWKMAKAYALLGEHLEAAENFMLASESYEKAAEKIPQLKKFYQEHASYMQAWSEFERAKHSHIEKRYLIAKEHYEKAAELHKSTERWSYLAPNNQAWASLEEAEDLSRKEQTEEAREIFRQANDLFTEAKGTIEIKLKNIQDEEEKKLLIKLTQASDIRREYCLGRTALEEGRILDRQGDHLASSKRYRSAAETFQRIAATSEEAKKELQSLVCLCQAWQKMTQAEARTSPELYSKASKLFEEAMEHSQDERSRRLALGHSRFCRALETGTKFEDTRDFTLYSEAIQHLGSAASHYLRAGFESAAEYARATQRLFDGYIYMDNAQKEVDPLRRARFYTMAERVLETSAGSYLMAKHPEKSEEVQRLLRRVREERELAATLSEVLHAPTTVSTTEAFTAPSPTREVAIGLERFENADIQANLILRGREVKVGDDVDIEIELVNAGKAPAQLIKVEEIIPKGFEVSSAPSICRVEDSYLDMKGRTLNPLKTAELKIVLRPLDKGTYQLKPRVLYLDEAGKYRSHEPEPATVVVKELGIKGWLRGPTR